MGNIGSGMKIEQVKDPEKGPSSHLGNCVERIVQGDIQNIDLERLQHSQPPRLLKL